MQSTIRPRTARGRSATLAGQRWAAATLFLLSLFPAALPAALCSVPGTHADLRCAIADLTCTDITLAAGTFTVDLLPIERDLDLHGAGPGQTTIGGQLSISGATSDVSLANVRLDATGASVAGCAEAALASSGGARVTSGAGLEVLDPIPTGVCRLFAEGFEGGSRCAWSFSTP